MNKVVVSAPGKIHLMGEHAVVYGKPALIAAINKRLVATVSASEKFEIESPEEKKLIEKAVEVVGKIKKGKFEASPGKHCEWCAYREICPFAFKS